jgi:hypothetical protein
MEHGNWQNFQMVGDLWIANVWVKHNIERGNNYYKAQLVAKRFSQIHRHTPNPLYRLKWEFKVETTNE